MFCPNKVPGEVRYSGGEKPAWQRAGGPTREVEEEAVRNPLILPAFRCHSLPLFPLLMRPKTATLMHCSLEPIPPVEWNIATISVS